MIFTRWERLGRMTKAISATGNFRAGHTIIEVLVAITILSFGILMIFNVFFDSVSAVKHLNNRIEARFILDEAESGLKKSLRADYILKDHTERKSIGENPRFDLILKIRKEDKFHSLYKMESTISWQEGNKTISLNREYFGRSPE